MADLDLREALRNEIRPHPRVATQQIFASKESKTQLANLLPVFLPFGGRTYQAAMWILDWDHRVPSREIVLRLYAYYSQAGRAIGETSFVERQSKIQTEDLFPEFDVSDFSGLVADEVYEAEGTVTGVLKPFRLVSEWRREIEPTLARKAEQVVRDSHHFKEVASETRARAPGLGDLEAAEWCPPSESGHDRWGIDVWYLRSFNGMVGEGTAFLVDLDGNTVVRQRDFQFRAG
jgi:hypothetical protein